MGVTYTLIFASLALNLIIRPESRFNILIWSLAVVAVVLPFWSVARWQFKVRVMNLEAYFVVLVAVIVWFLLTSLLWSRLGVEENESLGRGRDRIRSWGRCVRTRRQERKDKRVGHRSQQS